MTLTGRLEKQGSEWWLVEGSGRRVRLSGAEFPPRAEGLGVRVIGEAQDSFGAGVLHDEVVFDVQRWSVG
jgi:hypothetical protein